MVVAKWVKSQSKSKIPSRTIVDGEIVAGGISHNRIVVLGLLKF